MSAASGYSVDTSALIDGLERDYPEDVFPELWVKVDELVAAGRFFISEEVFEEVKKKDAVVKAWCSGLRESRIVIPTDAAIVAETQRILDVYPRLVMQMKGRNRADPFVIALASLRKAVVLTGEVDNGVPNRPRIPYVCNQEGIPSMRFLDMIRAEGWRF